MPAKTYDCYVVLDHVLRDGRWVPGVGAYQRDSAQVLEAGGWHGLRSERTLGIWLVENSQTSHARDLVLAHLAGHAPFGVTRLYDKHDDRHQHSEGDEA
jgi:hypothetical protein